MAVLSCSSRIDFSPPSHHPFHVAFAPSETTYLPAPGTCFFPLPKHTLLSRKLLTKTPLPTSEFPFRATFSLIANQSDAFSVSTRESNTLKAAKRFSDVKLAPLHDGASVQHVHNAVTFGTTSAIRLLKHALHGSTERSGQTLENVMTSF